MTGLENLNEETHIQGEAVQLFLLNFSFCAPLKVILLVQRRLQVFYPDEAFVFLWF